MENTEKDVRVYELGYWLVPTIPESGIETRVAELKGVLTAHNIELISEEAAYLREIAYEMCKVINNQNNYFNEGYFGWIKFAVEPAKMADIKKKLDLDQDIIRYMITQTVRENTVYTKRPLSVKKEEGDEVTEEKSEVVAEESAVVAEETPATNVEATV